MFYKSSILAAVFVLLSMSNAIAADISSTENPIAEQQSELIANDPKLQTTTTKDSASIAKARLLKVTTTDTKTDIELKISTDKNSVSTAKACLHNLSAKESFAPNSLPPNRLIAEKTIKDQIKNTVHTISSPIAYYCPGQRYANDIAQHQSLAPQVIVATSTNNQPELNNIPAISSLSIEQRKIADASSELNTIKQWEINKFVTLTDILLTPASVPNIAQAPERLPNNLVPSTVIEPQKPAIAPLAPTAISKPVTPIIQTPIIAKPTTPTVGTQKPTITSGANEAIAKPTAPTIETKKPEPPKPSPQVIEAQKPEPQNNEPKKWAVGVHTQFSSTGFFGVDAGYKFNPNLHARLGLNTVGFNVDYISQGIDYKAKFNPTNVHLLGDFFPFGGGLRLTGGLVFQSNQFNATGTPNSSAIPGGIPTQINLGGVNYNINDVGTVSSEGSFSNSVAPYLGIGFGTPISPGLGFNFDAGVMFAGSANVKLRANIPSSVPAALQTQIRNSLADQERRTNSDIGSFNVYPVVSVGISYAF
jgi:hypothetical protein